MTLRGLREKFDGLWREKFVYQASEHRIYRELSQPSRSLILERNKALRANPGAIRDLSFGRLALVIPLEDWDDLKRKYPDLASRDAEIKTKAWARFLVSAESEPYKVGTKP